LLIALDVVLRRKIGEVLNMLKPPAAFFELSVMSRVALASLRSRFTKQDTTTQPIPAMPPVLMPVG